MNKVFFIGSLLISCLTVAQPKESPKDSVILPIEIKGQLLENSNGEPIPYATIQYGQNKGVISNEEGRFRFLLDQVPVATDSMRITCMGFEQITLPLTGYKDSLIRLSSRTIDLKSVYVFDNPLTVEEIIAKIQENIPKNYSRQSQKTRFFLRQSNFNTVDKMDITFKKSSIAELNEELTGQHSGINSPIGSLLYRNLGRHIPA